MNESEATPFIDFLREGIGRGGFETDDVLAALLPLMQQVLAVHEAESVAPLDGIGHLTVTEKGSLAFEPGKVLPSRKNIQKIEDLQAPVSEAVEVLGTSRRTADLDDSSLSIQRLNIGSEGDPIVAPVYLPNYRSWEHALGHQDQLTDIFSIGLLLASVACGLDFTDAHDFELFAANRTNLFALNERLNPVLAGIIVEATELNRHKRAPDLGEIISRLKNYREQAVDLDFDRLQGFKESPLSGKRRIIHERLRDRLFEISRRNRLIYFKPTLQTLNLTIASVPLLLDYRSIKLEQLFVWHPDLAGKIIEGAPMPLGRYLRFEDAPYISGTLDKIISEARRDRTEFGFAQLRLVLCFLRWHNLKEAPHERIHSPLLLLPVDLTRKKGVRDSYVLDPSSTQAEVNPALRHHLKELYNLSLPEFIDLRETSLDQFWEKLKTQIQASEPGVTMRKIDRPQIEFIHEKARQRLDQYRRRLKLQARKSGNLKKPEYSYERENFRPLGLQLFHEKIRPKPMPLREAAGGSPEIRLPNMVEAGVAAPEEKVHETERTLYSLHDGDSQNPYLWDFDLCSLTLGNFNYRKMTLVSDFTKLIESDMPSAAFDSVFSLAPKPLEEAPPALELADQNLIISCDAAQASAISRARSGASYIIQGPPGTGKSQTITNLIADYVARGKRVLFVCEKRAAIDVVFHRLRRQGLDELCCLIHDSQTDKKAFIQNLKQTYEHFLTQQGADAEAESKCSAALRAMEQEIVSLQKFSDAMREANERTGISVRSLLHRLVELRRHAVDLPPEVEEALPDYPLWLEHGEVVDRLKSALADLGEELCFAKHPLRWIGKEVIEADRPIETMTTLLDKAEDLSDGVESALELSGLQAGLWDSFDELQAILQFAVRARPLAERQMLGVLMDGSAADAFQKTSASLDKKEKTLADAKQKTVAWKEPLSPADTERALTQAQGFEDSFLRFFQPAFWQLRKTLRARFDFGQFAVPPPWSEILKDLTAEHQAQDEFTRGVIEAQKQWQAEDVQALRSRIDELRNDPLASHPSVKGLIRHLAGSDEERPVIDSLAAIHEQFQELDATFTSLLVDHRELDFSELNEVLGQLRGQTGLFAELSPILGDIMRLPEDFARALRRIEISLGEFEGAIGHKSLNHVYRLDRAISRFEGRILARKTDQLEKRYNEWLALNARRIRAGVRGKFVEHVNISSTPAAQLNSNLKSFKKAYAAGRRDLEHEFGKTMRFKSIRDLAADETGQVIQDLKPIWLMSPLSVSDTLPLEPDLFDVVIFDEASQIPLEEAIPALYRSQQVIIVGDEMQLPPTVFFAATRGGDEDQFVVSDEGEHVEVDLNSESFLTQSAQNLPSTLLAWHYRSRSESLISFSNAAFYSGNLFTIPDRKFSADIQPEILVQSIEQGEANVPALLARSISFHFMEKGVYEDRTNPAEAAYIARLVRGLLSSGSRLSIGIVAFSEAQQTEIESALNSLAEEDSEFSARLEAEFVREDSDVFNGLFVKNLENVQGDERDVIIMSVCYGHDQSGRMLMNFGPINQRGGEKRLNVIFSRAKHHMVIVSSIRHHDITNDYNDGANSLKQFLRYAEGVSTGDTANARHVLENLNPLARKALAPLTRSDAVVDSLAIALRKRGYSVDVNVGQSKFRCDLAVRSSENEYALGILIDTEGHYANNNLLDRYLMQPSILRAFGWRVTNVLTKDWYHNPEDVLARIERLIRGEKLDDDPREFDEPPESTLAPKESRQPVKEKRAPKNRRSERTVSESAAVGGEGEKLKFRRFELSSEASRKFWEIAQEDESLTVRFGRIGTAGQSQTKNFADPHKAKAESEKLIAEKLKKGYAEK